MKTTKLEKQTMQIEEIVWHKYPEIIPSLLEDQYLVTHINGMVERAFYETGETLDGMEFTFVTSVGIPIYEVIAWAELPRGWVEK